MTTGKKAYGSVLLLMKKKKNTLVWRVQNSQYQSPGVYCDGRLILRVCWALVRGKVGGYWEDCHSEVDLWTQREKIKTVQVSISPEPT